MSKTTSIFQKLVFITGMFNFPIGIGLIAQVLMTPNPEILTIQTVLGAFILFAGAALMWASKDIQTRASIIVWNGLVRCVGFASVLFTSTIGDIPNTFMAIAGMDLLLALIYMVGSTKYAEISFFKLLFGKS